MKQYLAQYSQVLHRHLCQLRWHRLQESDEIKMSSLVLE